MTEIMERLSRELAIALGYPPSEAPRYRRAIERILSQLREPSTEMVRAGRAHVPEVLSVTTIWQAMVDAAGRRPE